jgi:hypothetical protein
VDEWRRAAPTRSSRTVELGGMEEREKTEDEERRGEWDEGMREISVVLYMALGRCVRT